jgi:hypothetical protein
LFVGCEGFHSKPTVRLADAVLSDAGQVRIMVDCTKVWRLGPPARRPRSGSAAGRCWPLSIQLAGLHPRAWILRLQTAILMAAASRNEFGTRNKPRIYTRPMRANGAVPPQKAFLVLIVLAAGVIARPADAWDAEEIPGRASQRSRTSCRFGKPEKPLTAG